MKKHFLFALGSAALVMALAVSCVSIWPRTASEIPQFVLDAIRQPPEDSIRGKGVSNLRDRQSAMKTARAQALEDIVAQLYSVVQGQVIDIFSGSEFYPDAEEAFTESITRVLVDGETRLAKRIAAGTDKTGAYWEVLEMDVNSFFKEMENCSAQYSQQIEGLDDSWESLRTYRSIRSGMDSLQRALLTYTGPGVEGGVKLDAYLTGKIRALEEKFYVASVEWDKFPFGSASEEKLRAALHKGLDNNNIPLQLVPPQPDSRPPFRFVISGEAVSAMFSFLRWKLPGLSIRFMRDNAVLASGDFPKTEINEEWLVYKTAKEIQSQTSFYQKIKEKLEQ